MEAIEAWVWPIALRAALERRPPTDRLDADLPALVELDDSDWLEVVGRAEAAVSRPRRRVGRPLGVAVAMGAAAATARPDGREVALVLRLTTDFHALLRLLARRPGTPAKFPRFTAFENMAGMLVQPALPAPLRAGLFRPLALVAGAKVIGRTTVAGRPAVIVGQLTAGMLTETHARILRRVSNLIDSGWAAWLPFELIDALQARGGNSAQRRSYRQRLERGPSETDRERWERFALVCPSRIDLPDQAGLDEGAVDRVLDDLGLLDAAPEAVELVLTLDQEDVRDLERIRSARDAEGVGAVPAGMPELNVLGGGRTGRNDPCPCGSGKKFKRCHGR